MSSKLQDNYFRVFDLAVKLESKDVLRVASLCKGIIEIKGTTPNLHELELSQRLHRWESIRKVQKDTFAAYMAEITEKETELLKVLKFPSIDEVRRAYIEDRPDEEGSFEYTAQMDHEVVRIFGEWKEELLGTHPVKAVDTQEATYPFWTQQAFSAAAQRYYEQIKDDLPDYLDPREVMQMIDISLENPYLRSIIRDGGKRITAELSQSHLREIRITLRRMGREGLHPISAARWLHKEACEGKAWWWLRITRSESGLAVNGAFDSSIEKYKVPYETWSAAAGACEVCSYFDGRSWKAGSGPRPILSSHPFCLCTMIAEYLTPENTEQEWNRPSPYERPYSPREMEIFANG